LIHCRPILFFVSKHLNGAGAKSRQDALWPNTDGNVEKYGWGATLQFVE